MKAVCGLILEYLQSICPVLAESMDEISKLIKVNELVMKYLQVDLSRIKCEDEPQVLFKVVQDMKYWYEIPEYTPEVLKRTVFI